MPSRYVKLLFTESIIMKTLFLGFFLLCIITLSGIFSRSDDKITKDSGSTVEGTLTLPIETNGKTWAVKIVEDINGDNGYVKIKIGTCGGERTSHIL